MAEKNDEGMWAISGKSTPKTIIKDMEKEVKALKKPKEKAILQEEEAPQKEFTYSLSKKDILAKLKNIHS